jgi:hypothetical protein
MNFRSSALARTTIITLALSLISCSDQNPVEKEKKEAAVKAAPAAGNIPFSQIGSKYRITGKLQVPIGKTVSITGKKIKSETLANGFLVEAIDGKALAKPITLLMAEVASWPENEKGTLEGYESASIVPDTTATSKPAKDPKEGKASSASPQKMILKFEVLKITERNGKPVPAAASPAPANP